MKEGGYAANGAPSGHEEPTLGSPSTHTSAKALVVQWAENGFNIAVERMDKVGIRSINGYWHGAKYLG